LEKCQTDHRAFLISFERGTPEWTLLGAPGVENLLAVKWRQLNQGKRTPQKRDAQVARLEEVLAE
jgi:hypothetical protein